jgi:hypothetical protein
MRALITMREALENPKLLGSILDGPSWRAWRVMLIAAMGEALNPDERALFRKFTGRDYEPGQMVEELWLVIGRQAGKSWAAAVLAAYIAGFCEYPELSLGDRGVVLFLAKNMEQARVSFNRTARIFDKVRWLDKLVDKRSANTLSLNNGVDLAVRAASSSGVRGFIVVGVVADEICFWPIGESANPDTEILNALRPALGTTGGPLIALSSPNGRRGEMYATYRRHFGPKGDPSILVVQGPTRDFNPSYSQRVIDRAYERDPVMAAQEYGAQFLPDCAALVTLDEVEAAVSRGRRERAPVETVHYFGFVDAASGGGVDSMTCAIAHMENGKLTLDAIREREPPFNLEAVVEEFAHLFKRYGVHSVDGDGYENEWIKELFRRHDIRNQLCKRTKSDLYGFFFAELKGNRIELLEHQRLMEQIVGLELRKSSSGRENIDHALNAHDDVINAVAGALWCATRPVPTEIELAISYTKYHDPLLEPEKGSYDYDPPSTRRIGRNW